MIASFVGDFVSVVSGHIQTAVPFGLPGVDTKAALSGADFKAGIVKQIELKFGSNDHTVGNLRFLHIFYGTKAHIFGILVKGCVFSPAYGTYIAAHGKRGDLGKGIHIGSVRVGEKYHIAFFNGGIAVVGAIEPDSVCKGVCTEPFHRYGNVAPASVNIRHFKVDHADLFFPA